MATREKAAVVLRVTSCKDVSGNTLAPKGKQSGVKGCGRG